MSLAHVPYVRISKTRETKVIILLIEGSNKGFKDEEHYTNAR